MINPTNNAFNAKPIPMMFRHTVMSAFMFITFLGLFQVGEGAQRRDEELPPAIVVSGPPFMYGSGLYVKVSNETRHKLLSGQKSPAKDRPGVNYCYMIVKTLNDGPIPLYYIIPQIDGSKRITKGGCFWNVYSTVRRSRMSELNRAAILLSDQWEPRRLSDGNLDCVQLANFQDHCGDKIIKDSMFNQMEEEDRKALHEKLGEIANRLKRETKRKILADKTAYEKALRENCYKMSGGKYCSGTYSRREARDAPPKNLMKGKDWAKITADRPWYENEHGNIIYFDQGAIGVEARHGRWFCRGSNGDDFYMNVNNSGWRDEMPTEGWTTRTPCTSCNRIGLVTSPQKPGDYFFNDCKDCEGSAFSKVNDPAPQCEVVQPRKHSEL